MSRSSDKGAQDRITARIADQRAAQERADRKAREYAAWQAQHAAKASRADKKVLRGRGGN